jgi:phosphoribosyl 1,2-cyclic phosphodiesterase
MRGWTLGSGSSGNALVLESGPHRLLLDCGFGPRAVATRLRTIGVEPESIGGLLLTHEHEDHAVGAARAQKKYRWPVIATAGTLRAVGEVEARWRQPMTAGTVYPTDGFLIEAVEVPHDAAQPCAFVVTATATGARVGIAHDLGAVPDALRAAFARCDALCLEANHDAEMLRTGPYPPALQARVSGGRGHLSNAGCGALASELAHPGLRGVVLLHLSAVNNTPELAGRTVETALRRAGHRARVRVAPRREVAVAFDLDGPRRAGQLALPL